VDTLGGRFHVEWDETSPVAPRVVFGTLTPTLFPEFCFGGVILLGAVKQLMEFF
jgi:hypothetical protein